MATPHSSVAAPVRSSKPGDFSALDEKPIGKAGSGPSNMETGTYTGNLTVADNWKTMMTMARAPKGLLGDQSLALIRTEAAVSGSDRSPSMRERATSSPAALSGRKSQVASRVSTQVIATYTPSKGPVAAVPSPLAVVRRISGGMVGHTSGGDEQPMSERSQGLSNAASRKSSMTMERAPSGLGVPDSPILAPSRGSSHHTASELGEGEHGVPRMPASKIDTNAGVQARCCWQPKVENACSKGEGEC